ncbi:hypothetical protein [Streptomyces viridosporus]|uniref:Uncharacterized protein n=1 Tax=Streptomyces viridosporus T7A TaxID=665577 RepID=A0ABX6AEV4_STRVD|nr:hypothetical protein [Streptomyces viridosporus]QEU85816.1 hypothetical protein CP969_14695 [Streptomyces viridosporus T7A]
MFKSKKIAAVTGVLGGFALIGVGAVQAVGAENPGNCVKDSRGTVRCEQVTEYEVRSKDHGKISFVNDSRQTCSGGPEVSCTSSVTLPG